MQFFINDMEVNYEQFSLNFPIIEKFKIDLTLGVAFQYKDNTLYLESKKHGIIQLNILNELKRHKYYFYKNSAYKHPLFKALGFKKGLKRPKVFDVTAGTLKDALLIYAFTNEIVLCERNPIIAFLIEQSLLKSSLPGFKFIFGDCRHFENEIINADVLYLDPMYETVNQKSLPRKEMQVFRDLIGEDTDRIDTFNFLKSFNKRIVVKRSMKSKSLLIPDISFGDKSTAYDVYLA